MIVMLFMVVGLAMAVSEVGQLLDESARARTAADAAALAGAAEGRESASSVAAANGGSLVSYSQEDSGDAGSSAVTVKVRVARASQTSRALALVEWTTPG